MYLYSNSNLPAIKSIFRRNPWYCYKKLTQPKINSTQALLGLTIIDTAKNDPLLLKGFVK